MRLKFYKKDMDSKKNTQIAILDRALPLRAYPEELLQTAILKDLLPFLTRLLSLTDEVSADRLEIALPAIKTQCIGMGFAEIKKMFEMYVDSKLSLKPIPNYFDRILLGKIITEYKSQNKKQIKPIENTMTEEDKENIMIEAVDSIKKEVKQNGVITSRCSHVYDYLDQKGKLPTDKESKMLVWEKASTIAKREAMEKATQSYEEHVKLKAILEKLDAPKGNGTIVAISKRLVLEEYFRIQ